MGLHVRLFTFTDGLIAHLLLIRKYLGPLLLLSLTCLDGQSDHFFLFPGRRISFLLRHSGHLHRDTQLLIFIIVRILGSHGISGGLG